MSTEIACPSCDKTNVFSNGYKSGTVVTCAYENCKKKWAKIKCPHCSEQLLRKGTDVESFNNGKVTKCPFENCKKKWARVKCPYCSETLERRDSDPKSFNNGNVTTCPYQNCKKKWAQTDCPSCDRYLLRKSSDPVHFNQGDRITCCYGDCNESWSQTQCSDCSALYVRRGENDAPFAFECAVKCKCGKEFAPKNTKAGTISFPLASFASGAFREAFKCEVKSGEYKGFSNGTKLVLKSIKPSLWNKGTRVTARDVWMQSEVVKLADEFNRTHANLDEPIYVRDSRLSKMHEDKLDSNGRIVFRKNETVALEQLIHGDWEKFNSNSGWSCGNAPILDAFSHWTYAHTGGLMLVCDLQGARGKPGGPTYGDRTKYFLLTDPCICSSDQKFGISDCGRNGIANWFSHHSCNAFCKSFGITTKKPISSRHCAARRGSVYANDPGLCAAFGSTPGRYVTPVSTIPRQIFKSGPFGRTFGVELEVPTGKSRNELISGLTARGHKVEGSTSPEYTHDITTGWKVVSDGSITGWEVVSPVLCHLGGIAEVLKMCYSLKALGCDIPASDTSCGFHVHVGAKDLNGNAVARLIRFHNHAETTGGLNNCVPPSRRNSEWCKATHDGILEAARAGPITFNEVRALSEDRYVSLNMFGRCKGYGTVEFRRHGGTLDGEKAVAWILLCLCMVSSSLQLGRSGYGKNLSECITTIGMFNNGKLVSWAAQYLLARHRGFTSGKHEVLPVLPGKEQLANAESSGSAGVGLTSFDAVVPFLVPKGCGELVGS